MLLSYLNHSHSHKYYCTNSNCDYERVMEFDLSKKCPDCENDLCTHGRGHETLIIPKESLINEI